MKLHVVLLALSLFLLSACAEPMNNAQKGALFGAVGGALAGQAIGRDTKGTLIGAAAGAAVGGGAGHYMDRQEAATREALESVEGVNIVRNGDEIFVTFRSDNQFGINSFTFNPEAQQDVGRLGQVLAEFDKTTILVAGHTDSTGSEQLNQTLSENRAKAVKNILLAQGVAANRLSTIGFGESSPIAENTTDYGRQQNRRVEIKISPK
ncbi:MAG TPA: OmpA family protein [Geopsychrobacteraceae bacterium]|nr:OmpA family protein [Geopsychrobacteraceae bacterium]